MSRSDQDPWYRDGLAFQPDTRCVRAAPCARGYVWVNLEEIQELAEFQELSVEEFGRQFLRKVGDRLSLIERPGGDCIFWDRVTGCTG